MKTDDNMEIEKTFGLCVLLKLIKRGYPEVEIRDTGKNLLINKSLAELDEIVTKVLEENNINLKVG